MNSSLEKIEENSLYARFGLCDGLSDNEIESITGGSGICDFTVCNGNGNGACGQNSGGSSGSGSSGSTSGSGS